MPSKTWRERAHEIIREVTKDLPEKTTLKQRKKILKDARPTWGFCSWPQKAWQKARREYLVQYGYIPKTKPKGKNCPGPGGLLDLMNGKEAK